MSDDVQLTDLPVLQRYSLAVRAVGPERRAFATRAAAPRVPGA